MFVPAREDHVGRIAGILLIDLVEILVIGKTHQLRDLVELALAALLQLHGAPNAVVIEKIVERVARFRLELGVQVRAGNVELLAEIGEVAMGNQQKGRQRRPFQP